MKTYDKRKPLVVIHIPKASGRSFGKILEAWYGNRLLLNYFNETKGEPPVKHEVEGLQSGNGNIGICIFGHFNSNREFGVQDYYPEADQFVTILRDPFELAVSEYFYLRKVGYNWKDQTRIPVENIRDYLLHIKPNMLNHFPFKMTIENYRRSLEQHFIHIGITEDLKRSVAVIAEKLGFDPPKQVPHINITERIDRVPYELKKEFIEKHVLEHAVYQFAVENYLKA